MSTKSTIRHYQGGAELPAWHLYEEAFEKADVVYLELAGVQVDMMTLDEPAPRVVLPLPTSTAEQLGLLPKPAASE
ncbi:hypothetical protein PXJ20_32110 [Paraburkholderia sp. A1RI_3L]|uniref:hypothetical protein n=1 Tax=Paraburkholderia TaxID=1822464 RepID=UPI003B8248F1